MGGWGTWGTPCCPPFREPRGLYALDGSLAGTSRTGMDLLVKWKSYVPRVALLFLSPCVSPLFSVPVSACIFLSLLSPWERMLVPFPVSQDRPNFPCSFKSEPLLFPGVCFNYLGSAMCSVSEGKEGILTKHQSPLSTKEADS